LLALKQGVLACDRQARQRRARVHLGGIYAAQHSGKSAAVLLGVGDLQRQSCQQGGFTFGRRPVFERVEK